jgi:hypothetical protein
MEQCKFDIIVDWVESDRDLLRNVAWRITSHNACRITAVAARWFVSGLPASRATTG